MDRWQQSFVDVTARKPSGWLGKLMYRKPVGHYGFFRVAADFFRAQDASEFAPYVCLYDFPTSELWGTGLVRTMTLAEGAEKCDDRFRLGRKPVNRQKTRIA